ncbi:MAG: hypothetical protein JRD89_16830 [Deltaproteobacteria bacterium]|nr:hypothetical protein [Deltaproteobacteria bacterium]
MRYRNISINLREDQIEWINSRRLTVSQLVREALDHYKRFLEGEEEC